MFLPKPAEKSLWKPCSDPGAGRRENRGQWGRQTKGSCQQGCPSTVGQVTGFLPAGRGPQRRGESGRPPGATPRPVELRVLTSGLCALQEVQTPRGSSWLGMAWPGAALGAPTPALCGLCLDELVVYGGPVPLWAWVCSLQAWALPSRSLGAGTSPPRPTSAPVFLEPATQVASLHPGSPPPDLTLAFQNVLETIAPTLPPTHGDPQPQN